MKTFKISKTLLIAAATALMLALAVLFGSTGSTPDATATIAAEAVHGSPTAL
jgi:hypothetical protein